MSSSKTDDRTADGRGAGSDGGFDDEPTIAVGERPGELVAGAFVGRYRIIELLGKGAMGQVYKAFRTDLDLHVALKVLNPNMAGLPNVSQRFVNEARAASRINHENIVRVLDVGVESGIAFLVMEYLDGEPLDALLGQPLPVDRALALLLPTIAAVDAAHQKGVVHRDLKPANIFVAKDARGGQSVKVVDFGISKLDHADAKITATGDFIGTPGYAAPEQLRDSKSVGPFSDQYSIGVILYEALSGHFPFAAESAYETVHKVLGGDLPPISEFATVPPGLARAVHKAMALRPEDRFSSLSEFATTVLPFASAGTRHRYAPMFGADPLAAGDAPPPATPTRGAKPPTRGARPDQPTRGAEPDPPPTPKREERASPSTLPIASPALVTASAFASQPKSSGRTWLWLGLGALILAGLVTGALFALKESRSTNDPDIETTANTPAAPAPATELSGESLRLGIPSGLAEDRLANDYVPLSDYLSQELSRPTRLIAFRSYDRLARALDEDEVDIAWLPPYDYQRSRDHGHGLALLAAPVEANSQRTYQGIIVALAGDDAPTELAELADKRFCYVNPTSSSGYLYPRELIEQSGLDPDTLFRSVSFVGNHQGILPALRNDECDAAATHSGILFGAEEAGESPENFAIIASTGPIRYGPYVASNRLGPELIEKLRSAFLALTPESPAAQEVFGDRAGIRGFEPADPDAYDNIGSVDPTPIDE